jgi:hypothetical protein
MILIFLNYKGFEGDRVLAVSQTLKMKGDLTIIDIDIFTIG